METGGPRYCFPDQLRPELKSSHRNAAGSRLSKPEMSGDRAIWEHRSAGAGRLCVRTNLLWAPRIGTGHACGYRPSPVPHLCPGSGTSSLSSTRMPDYAEQPKEPCGARGTQELAAASHQVALRKVRYLPSQPLQMPGGRAAGNPGPSPASGPQAEPQRRRAASQGAAALPAGGFSVSFRALAGTGLPGARRGRGRECARVGRCGRAWMWVCMCVCVFMGEVGVCVRV